MNVTPTDKLDAEIEALRQRIKRLRLERKAALIAENERRLLQLAHGEPSTNAEVAK